MMMLQRFKASPASLMSWPSWLDPRFALVLPAAAVELALGWGIASPEQRSSFGSGDLAGIWPLVASVLVVTAVLGLLYMAIDETDTSDTDKPKRSSLHWMTDLRDLLCHMASSVSDITAKVLALPIVAVTRVAQRSSTSRRRLIFQFLDCWPTGRSPRVVYEQPA